MSDENSPVMKDLCKVIHKGVDERLDGIDCCIKEIREVVVKMGEISARTEAILKMLMDERTKNTEKVSPPMPKQSFWDTKAGAIIPWAVMAVIIIGMAALVGTNIIEGIQAAKGLVKP